jgi:hypothetical protein
MHRDELAQQMPQDRTLKTTIFTLTLLKPLPTYTIHTLMATKSNNKFFKRYNHNKNQCHHRILEVWSVIVNATHNVVTLQREKNEAYGEREKNLHRKNLAHELVKIVKLVVNAHDLPQH